METIDQAVLENLRKGKMYALKTVYDAYNGWVYNFVFSLVKDSSTAQDITHDVFLHIWIKRMNIDVDGNFEGYLFSVARHAVYHYLHRELLRQNIMNRLKLERQGYAAYIERDIDRHLVEEQILKLTTELPEARRQVFMLYWKSDMTYREIAALLSISEKTVATQVRRVLHFLQSKLKYFFLFLVILFFMSVLYIDVLTPYTYGK